MMKDSTFDSMPLVGGLIGAIAVAALVFLGNGCAIQEHTAEVSVNVFGVEPRIALRSKGIEFGCPQIVVTNVTCGCAAIQCSGERESARIDPPSARGKGSGISLH